MNTNNSTISYFFQRLKEKAHAFYHFSKEKIKAFLSWNSDSTLYWFIKLLILIIVFTFIILFFKYVFPTLLGVILIIFLLISDNLPNNSNSITVVPDASFVARDLIYSILHKKAIVIDAETPQNVEDITPTKYPIIKHIGNIIFYSFIVRFLPEHDTDFIQKRKDLNILIEQKLSAGFPNVSQPFFRGIPAFVVIAIDEDSTHRGYFCIDVMPVVDNASYNHVLQIEYQEKLSAQSSVNAPTDKDF